MQRKSKARRNTPRSGKNGGGGGGNGGGGKRGIPVKGWEKGDIARDMVMQADDPDVPRKPGSSRVDKTISAAKSTTPKSSQKSAADSQEKSGE